MYKRQVKTNVDSLVGERAVLTEDADSMKQTGKAVVNGQEWTCLLYTSRQRKRLQMRQMK